MFADEARRPDQLSSTILGANGGKAESCVQLIREFT
jgi:hypothetical protein